MKGRSVCFVSIRSIDLANCPGNHCKQKCNLLFFFCDTCVTTWKTRTEVKVSSSKLKWRSWPYFQWPPTETVSFLQVSTTRAIAHTARQQREGSLHQLWMTASRQLTPMPAPWAHAKPCWKKNSLLSGGSSLLPVRSFSVYLGLGKRSVFFRKIPLARPRRPSVFHAIIRSRPPSCVCPTQTVQLPLHPSH